MYSGPRWKWLTVFWGCFALTGTVFGKDAYPVLVYPVPEVKTPIQMDGRVNEPAWQEAPLVSGFTFYDRQALAPVQTAFRVLFDPKGLYFGIICEEPQMKRLPSNPLPRDQIAILEREAMEIFLDPLHDHLHYFQFGVDAAGSLFDGKETNVSWNSHFQAAVRQEKDAWTVELALPWEDLGVHPEPGKIIGFNVCRDRYLQGRQWTNWSQTQANFHDPERFAHLVLAPTPAQLGALEQEFRKGDRSGPLEIFGPEGFSGHAYRALLQRALGEAEGLLNELKQLQGKEAADVSAELADHIKTMEEEISPLRQRIHSSVPVDAREWVQKGTALTRFRETMKAMVWEARLAALLKGI